MRIARAAAAAGVLPAILLPHFASDYYVQLACVAIVYAVLAQGYDILLGWGGQFALSHAALFGIGAYSVALLTTRLGIPYWPALMLAIPITVLAAVVTGWPMLRLKGHYLAMGTLAFGLSVELVLSRWQAVTGGTDGIRNIPAPAIGPLVLDSPARYYYLLLFTMLLMLWVTRRLWHSALADILHVVREHELTAAVLGVNVPAAKLIVLGISAAYAAAGGGLYAGLFRYVSPETYGLRTAILLLMMVVLGGSRTLAGPTLGAALLVALPEALRFMRESYLLVYGVTVILIVSLMPGGLVGLGRALTDRKGGSRPAPRLDSAGLAEAVRRG